MFLYDLDIEFNLKDAQINYNKDYAIISKIRHCHLMSKLTRRDPLPDTTEINPLISPTLARMEGRGHPVADPETSERGRPRNMKYKPLRAAAIFFGLFSQARGGQGDHGSATDTPASNNPQFLRPLRIHPVDQILSTSICSRQRYIMQHPNLPQNYDM